MKNIMNNPKAVAAAVTALLLVCVLWLGYEMRINGTLEEGMNSEKLRTESLLSEKLLLEKESTKLRGQISNLSGKNQEMDRVLKQTSAKLDAKENEFNKVKKENVSLQQVRKQNKEIQTIKMAMEKELETLTASYKSLQMENKNLNMSVANLEERNKTLNDELQKAILASVDRTQFDALKGRSGVLTVKASRARKLVANFSVPAGLKEISFRVIDPSGNMTTPKDGTIASRVVTNSNGYAVSTAAAVISPIETPTSMEVVYVPIKKLKVGTYRIEILTGNKYVGSTQVKLR